MPAADQVALGADRATNELEPCSICLHAGAVLEAPARQCSAVEKVQLEVVEALPVEAVEDVSQVLADTGMSEVQTEQGLVSVPAGVTDEPARMLLRERAVGAGDEWCEPDPRPPA